MHINILDDIVSEYNNTYHSTIKMKPIDVKSSTCIDFGIKNNDNDLKFEVGYHVRISSYKNILANGYVSNLPEEVLVIKNVKSIGLWKYVIEGLNGKEVVGTFHKKNCKRQVKHSLRLLEKVIKEKSDKLYVNCKDYDNSFNSCIDKKDIVI